MREVFLPFIGFHLNKLEKKKDHEGVDNEV